MTLRQTFAATVLSLSIAVGGCSTTSSYGPLTFNGAGTDFYFAQAGQFARTELGSDGVIEVKLSNAPFQIGYNGRQLNLALAQTQILEISTDPKGFKASRLSGPLTGGREMDSAALLVYSGKEWSDGNTEFSDSTSRKASPMPGFQFAYQIDELAFVADETLTLGNFKGVLYGFIVVYKQPERRNRDTMPIRMIFK
jgi:hypothetical protein